MRPQNNKQENGVAPQVLNEEPGRDAEAIANLVGYFDVLIQMDLENKRKEKERKKEND